MPDLTYLDFSESVGGSTPGAFPKAYSDGVFYKLDAYNSSCGFYGFAIKHEIIASRFLRSVGIDCLAYSGHLANISFDGKIMQTFVCYSRDYRGDCTDLGLESKMRLDGVSTKEVVVYMRDKGWGDWLDNMLVADFLVGNRDRHGSNIRVLSDGKLSPLFDFNLSLFSVDGQSRGHDVLGNNFIGSPSLRDNLKLVINRPALKPPYMERVFEGLDYPYRAELETWLWERFRIYETF